MNTISQLATIFSIDKLAYAICKTMAEYHSKYYTLKASIKNEKIGIDDALEIRMLNIVGPNRMKGGFAII